MSSLLVPATYDLAWSVAVLLVPTLAVVLTIVSLVRWRRQTRPEGSAVAWLLVILLLPGLGAAVHLAVTPRPEPVGEAG